MISVATLGLQWGDEGKGKIVDVIVDSADAVVRFQGGNNAGHTVVHGDIKYKLSLLPSGILSQNTICLIAGGVVIDPTALLNEIQQTKKAGINISPHNLGIAENASLILSWHRELDGAREKLNNDNSTFIGTTKRGIGPAYEDRVGRRAIRICDLRDSNQLRNRLSDCAIHHNALRRFYNLPEVDIEATITELEAISNEILQYTVNVPSCIRSLLKGNKRIVFEGAQGIMLDNDHGTYPFVTSSNTTTAQAAVSCGIPPNAINRVLGVCKGYTTRVGEGPFPSEFFDDIAEHIGTKGNEFGTVTSRKRRIGWIDTFQLREAINLCGVHHIALTKIDVLDGLKEVELCTGYKLNGEVLENIPANADDLAKVEPVLEKMPGWPEGSSESAKSRDELHPNAQEFLTRIERLLATPITIISTSPNKDDTIVEVDPFYTPYKVVAANT